LIKNVAGTVTLRGFSKKVAAMSGVEGIGTSKPDIPWLSSEKA